jgi:uncharacterized protein with FMN-binding domain
VTTTGHNKRAANSLLALSASLGWRTSRHGDIQAQVAQRHSPEVDDVSGATQSANAFYYAVVDARSKAT